MADTAALEDREGETLGKAFIFALDSWVYNSLDSPPGIIDVTHGEYAYRFYPPFPNNPFRALAANSLGPNSSIPFLPGANLEPQTLAVLPSLIAVPLIPRSSDGPRVQLIIPGLDGTVTSSPDAYLPSNLLRIDVYGHGQDASPKAETLRTSLMRIIRWHTQQWWISRRGTLSVLSPLVYDVNRHGETVVTKGEKRAGAGVSVRTLSGYEKALDHTLWEQSLKDAFAHLEPPTHWNQLLDAQYFLALGDIAQSSLAAASGCDILKERTFEALWKTRNPGRRYSSSQRWRLISGWQMPAHIDSGLNSLIGRSYRNEHPQEWDNINHLWEVRNKVAHGDAPSFGTPSLAPTDADLETFISSGRHLLKWLEALT